MVVLNPNELTLLGLIREEGPFSLEVICKVTYRSEKRIKSHLQRLIKLKYLKLDNDLYSVTK